MRRDILNLASFPPPFLLYSNQTTVFICNFFFIFIICLHFSVVLDRAEFKFLSPFSYEFYIFSLSAWSVYV